MRVFFSVVIVCIYSCFVPVKAVHAYVCECEFVCVFVQVHALCMSSLACSCICACMIDIVFYQAHHDR